MSLFADIGDLTGNQFLSTLGSTSIGQKYGDKIISSVNKQLTPKPAPQVVAPSPASTVVSVSSPDQGMMKKVLMIAGGIVGLLAVVYFVKKGR